MNRVDLATASRLLRRFACRWSSRAARTRGGRDRALGASVCGAAFVVTLGGFAPGSASAQWTSDPAVNTPFVTKPGEQTQPKVVPTADGGAFVSWFDNETGGYDVYMQRINAEGVPVWDTAGVLIADRSFSSTQDYGLALDDDGHAVVAFRDDRFGGIVVTANRVAPDGTLVWGEDGVQPPLGGGFIGPIRAAATSDGASVVGWLDGTMGRVVKLNSAGEVLWVHDFIPPVNSYTVSYLVPSDAPGETGEVIVLLTTTGTFAAPRHIYAQKLNSAGNALWGESPVAIYTGPSIQIGYFPHAITDGAGGMVLAWYQTSPLQVRVQRLDVNGAAYYEADGLVASTNATQLRVSPDVTFDPQTQEITTFWTELNSFQSQWGVYGQRIDVKGARLWSDAGAVLVPLGPTEITQVRALSSGSEALAGWVETLSFGNQRLWTSRRQVDGSGAWSPVMLETSSAPSGKSRTVARTLTDGSALFTWVDTRNDSGDIFAQRVNPDGSLGPGAPACAFADLNCDGAVGVADLLILLSDWGRCAECSPDACPADLTGDCGVGVGDLLALLSSWG